MKKELCILTYVFGEQYQDYIPLFIYSILKAYPDYFPIIFSELPIVKNVAKQLDMLREIGEFKIYDRYSPIPKLKGQRAKSIRWLFECEELAQYEAAYVGDIDIIIINESPALFKQHMVHCDIIGFPYSNLVRIAKKNHSLWEALKENGLYGVLVSAFNFKYTDRKLTGLHFYKIVEYMAKLRPLIPLYLEHLQDHSLQALWVTKHHSNCFSNENFLYDLMMDSGIGVPPVVEDYGPHLLDYRNYDQVGFRPHHGIHLGVFRSEILSEHDREMLMSDFYKEYYRQFCLATKNDDFYRKMSACFSPYLINLLEKMDKFYEGVS